MLFNFFDKLGRTAPVDFDGIPPEGSLGRAYFRDGDDIHSSGVVFPSFAFPWVDLGKGNDFLSAFSFDFLPASLKAFGREGRDELAVYNYGGFEEEPIDPSVAGTGEVETSEIFLNGGLGDDLYTTDIGAFAREEFNLLSVTVFDLFGQNTTKGSVGGFGLNQLDLSMQFGRNIDDAQQRVTAQELNGEIRLGNGPNTLDLTANALDADLVIKGGSGTDIIDLDFGAVGWDDVIGLDMLGSSVAAESDIEIYTFEGHDEVNVTGLGSIEGTLLESNLLIHTGYGNDVINVDLALGNGRDGGYLGAHVIKAGTGDDVITLTGLGTDMGATVVGGTGDDVIETDSLIGALRGGTGADTFIVNYSGFIAADQVVDERYNSGRLIVDFDESEGDVFFFNDFDPFDLGPAVNITSVSDLRALADSISGGELEQAGDSLRLTWDTGVSDHPVAEILFTDILA